MKQRRNTVRLFGLALAITLIISGAVVQGVMTERWGAPDRASQVAQRFEHLPEKVGPWKLQSTSELSESAAEQLQCHGYISHKYVNEVTQEVVRVAVLMGPPGPIAVHTPEICYSSRDYKIDSPRKAVPIDAADGKPDTLWGLRFKSRDVSAHRLQVYYGWTVDGVWEASENPRFGFSGNAYLFKIQLAAVVPEGGAAATDACRSFLKDFTPMLRRRLFAPAPSPSRNS